MNMHCLNTIYTAADLLGRFGVPAVPVFINASEGDAATLSAPIVGSGDDALLSVSLVRHPTVSGPDVMMITSEHRAITELLQLFKDLPCLWDQQHLLYCNKEARNQAYSVLLEKFKYCQEDATLDTLKKKIENMRTAYRREHKKVLAAKSRGEKEHRPTLWYYDLLSFLKLNIFEGKTSNDSTKTEDPDDSEETHFEESEYAYEDVEEEEPKPKKQKLSSIFLPEHNTSELCHKEDDELSLNSLSTESLAFGRTIGLQLKDLEGFQRIIAEKLISDVIFYARLNKYSSNKIGLSSGIVNSPLPREQFKRSTMTPLLRATAACGAAATCHTQLTRITEVIRRKHVPFNLPI